MSALSLTMRRGFHADKYLPEITTGFADLAKASRLTNWLHQILPGQRASSFLQEDEITMIDSEAGKWSQELRHANAVLVTALIEASSIGSENDSTRPVTLTRLTGLTASATAATNPFNDVSISEEPVDFHWSKAHYRIHQLVREFSEQTHANY